LGLLPTHEKLISSKIKNPMPEDLTKSSFIAPRRLKRRPDLDRTVLHIDMDAFFAQVEQATNPKLRGRPIAVVGRKKRTVIVTSSYEARAEGVKTGMTVGEGQRVCPGLILVAGNNHKYIDTSVRIIAILREFSPQMEVYSIDEAFVDVTGSLRLFGGTGAIARGIKAKIKDEMGLTCSIGVAPNKLLAKLASDLEKPDGLVMITGDDIPGLMEGLPIGKMFGIGKKTERKLRSLGIETCGDLGRYPKSILKRKFGIIGEHLHYMGLGTDESPVVPLGEEEAAKSIGHSMTFPEDVEDKEGLKRYLLLLSGKVGRRARRWGCSGRTVSLYVRFSDFAGTGKRKTLERPINLDIDIFCAAANILETISPSRPVRLLGVSLSNLTYSGLQLPLLSRERREFILNNTIDNVKDLFGDESLTYATVSEGGLRDAGVISPAWRPEGTRRVDPR